MVGEWIKVSDRLPSHIGWVLVARRKEDDKEVFPAYCDFQRWFNDVGDEMEAPLYWMELPKHPEVVQ